MVKKKYFFILWLFTLPMLAQELNCNLVVNAQQTGNENVQVFKTLEKQLYEFVNNTRWTNKTYETHERIDCSMVIIIQSYSSDAFQASIQVQSARPARRASKPVGQRRSERSWRISISSKSHAQECI